MLAPAEWSYTIRPTPPPINISLINSSIELFAMLFSLQSSIIQESTLDYVRKVCSNTNIANPTQPAVLVNGVVSINPVIRKNTCIINTLCAIVGVLKNIAVKRGDLNSEKVQTGIRDLVEVLTELIILLLNLICIGIAYPPKSVIENSGNRYFGQISKSCYGYKLRL